MAKGIYILMIFVLGFALTPSVAMACGSKSEKCCCCKKGVSGGHSTKKSETKHPKKQSCCEKAQSDSEDKGDCGGNCGDKSCKCPTSNVSSALLFLLEISYVNFDFSTEKQKSVHTETHLSSGFYSIWSPPNIG